MWFRTHIIMKKRGIEDVAGEYRAVLELADAIRAQLQPTTPSVERGQEPLDNISAFTESKLRRRITKDMHGGSISYVVPLLYNGENGEGDGGWGFRAWVKSNRWSIFTFLVSVALLMTNVILLFIPTPIIVFLSLPLTWFFSIHMGTSSMSRVVLFFWFFVIMSVVPQAIYSGLVPGSGPY
ncbi:hypothetical protein EJ02DRAFT_426675 [Clathrospora elynae]|uniref:Uncharacterized protein n=1 Tax=Clathrospora elynae TaxID=706981 RepID=A0A6A5SCJ1_9PLEO|nr:hypothetical protein EJ02DRAFT_426675 [Clathrospora elynae]